MITGTLSTGQKIQIPQAWEEVTVAQYVALQGKVGNEKLSALTGLPTALLAKIPEEDITALWGVLSFASEDIPYNPGALHQQPIIALEPVIMLERSAEYLRKYPYWDCCPNVYAVFYGPKLDDYKFASHWIKDVDKFAAEVVDHLPITEVYTTYIYIEQEIARFLNRYKAIFEKKPTGNEEAAGIHVLAKYGYFGTFAEKCNRDPTKLEPMYRTLADTFYTMLLWEMEANDYNKRLHELNNPPTK